MSAPGPSTPVTTSGRASRRASLGAREAIHRSQRTPVRAPRKKRAAEELIGRRLSVSWPEDRSYYEARCIDYNPAKKTHKVIYDADDSIEEVAFGRRKWKPLEESVPEQDTEGHHALVGKMIILPAKSSETLNPAEPDKDFRACVIGVVEEDAPAQPRTDPSASRDSASVVHQIVYVSNEHIVTVDLSAVKYFVIDNVTGDVLRTVNPDKELVELDPPDSASSSTPVPGTSIAAESYVIGSGAPVEEEIVASGNADSTFDDNKVSQRHTQMSFHASDAAKNAAVASNASYVKKLNDQAAIASETVPKGNDSARDLAPPSRDLPSPAKRQGHLSAAAAQPSFVGGSPKVSEVSAKKSSAVPDPSLSEASTPGSAVAVKSFVETHIVPSASGSVSKSLEAHAVQPTRPSSSPTTEPGLAAPTPPELAQAKSVPGRSAYEKLPTGAEGSTQLDTDTGSGVMAAADATATADANEIEEDMVAAEAAVVMPDYSMDEFPEPVTSNQNIADLVAGPFGGAITGKSAPAPGNTIATSVGVPNGAKDETVKKEDGLSGDVSFQFSVEEAMMKPLTQENLDLLDSKTGGEIKPTVGNPPTFAQSALPGAEALAAGKDEDTKTISDGEDAAWVMNSPRTSDRFAQSRVNKYISLTVGESQRKAYVEAYFQPKQTHFVAFCDAVGGNMQVRLTEENHRLLTQMEIDTLSKRLSLDNEHPSPNRNRGTESSRAGGRRRSASGGDQERGTAIKRARRVSLTPAGPGADLIGQCITVRWPGNGGNYVALVVGFNNRMHKVYYVADESTEILDLSKREWVKEGPGTEPWDRNGLVGKRLFVYWPAEYTEDHAEDQLRSEEKFGKGNTMVPFEAFVVQFIDSFRYRLLYTQDDNLEDRDLTQEDSAWDVLEPGVMKVDEMSVISWSARINATS